jgi:hypothetical protein
MDEQTAAPRFLTADDARQSGPGNVVHRKVMGIPVVLP